MDKQIAYSLLTVKEVSEDKRVIRGMATTPEPDRVGDIVEPLGVQFKNPAPLLWMHRHELPVGTVNFGKPTKDGVPFEATLPVVSEPSQLKARIDEAWQSVKAGLVRAVSIGFKPLEYSVMDEGGYRFTRSEVFELSLVTVPANGSATINYVKSLDREVRAALGTEVTETVEKPSTSAMVKKTVKLNSKKEIEMSLQDKLKAFQDELKAKKLAMTSMVEKSAEAGETFNAAEQEEFNTLKADVQQLEKHIEDTEFVVKMAVKTATPVTETAGATENGAAQARAAIVVKAPKLDAGIGFARVAISKALSKMENVPAYEVAKARYGENSDVYGILKTAVTAGTTAHSTWAKPLVGQESDVFADFLEFLRPQTIIGKFGMNGMPALNRVPFRTRLLSQTSGGNAKWVGEGAAKPLTKFDFAGTTLEPLKVANIAVVTMELIRDSSPSAETLVRNGLAAALTERLDIDFLDPAKDAAAGVSPASLSYGVSTIHSTGTDADAVRCDIAALLSAYVTANNPPMSGVIVMSATKAIALMTMRNALGQREFPEMTMNGGILEGFPVMTSQYIDQFSDTAGGYVFMVNGSDVWVGDEGGITVDMSEQASLQMDDSPTQNGTSPTATAVVSLWQNNLVGFRAERTINWKKARTSAVAVLDQVNWTACPTT